MYHRIRLTTRPARDGAEDVAVALFEKVKRLPRGYSRLGQPVHATLSAALKRREFSASKGVVTTLYVNPTQKQTGPGRVFVLGLGRPEEPVADALRLAGAGLVRSAYAAGIKRVGLHLAAGLGQAVEPAMAGRAISDGMSIARFDFRSFKGAVTAHQAPRQDPESLMVYADPAMRQAVGRGLLTGESVQIARDLAATPPNVANPSYLVRFCRTMARRVGLRCTVIDARRAAQLGMGGLVAVGRSGSTAPALICLEHRPSRAKGQPILMVGKAVTFDTGGYSIKSSEGMDAMKYDKCGGTALIGAMHAVARLKLPVPVVGLVAAAENMVSETAYRPGDIIHMFNGVTVEVTNTDAEGRLILGDALAYGCQRYRPRAVIDLATLTGGVVVALGSHCAGVFCNDGSLKQRLLKAAADTGERIWQLPLWEEHRRQLEGTHGDIVNSAGREAHPCQGAAFLSYFVNGVQPLMQPAVPWAHLDVAGVSDVKSNDHPLYAKGPTGFGVRLLVRVVESWV